MLIAVAATVFGVAIEAGTGHRELGMIFAVCYALGCIGAVLAVRQSAIFTAVIQPPLLLFVAVPLAYFLFHGEELSGLKGFLITCGYPLIERFPLMLFTAATVLAIGLARRFLPAPAAHEARHGGPDRPIGGLAARLFARPGGPSGREAGQRPRHSARPAHPGRDERERPTRPRRDERDPAPQQRRRRPPGEVPPERRRQRPAREPGWAEPPRRAPRERRDPRNDNPPRPRRAEGYEPRRGYEPREDYRGYPPPRPRSDPAPRRDAGDHHPVSRVRYRGGDPGYPPRRDT